MFLSQQLSWICRNVASTTSKYPGPFLSFPSTKQDVVMFDITLKHSVFLNWFENILQQVNFVWELHIGKSKHSNHIHIKNQTNSSWTKTLVIYNIKKDL